MRYSIVWGVLVVALTGAAGCSSSSVALEPALLSGEPNSIQAVVSRDRNIPFGPNVSVIDRVYTDSDGNSHPLPGAAGQSEGVVGRVIQAGGLIGAAAVLSPSKVDQSGGGASSSSSATAQ